jgi:hypothetical protein
MRNHQEHTRARIAVGLTLASVVAGGVWLAPTVLAEPGPAPAPDWDAIQLQPLDEGQHTLVTGINDDGLSVGSSGDTPVVWDADGVPSALELPEGCDEGLATTIDGSGAVAGFADCGATDFVGLTWSAEGDVTVLEDPLVIHDRTDSGIAVGQRDPDSSTNDVAFAYANGQRLDLWDAGASSSSANAITEYGFVVGDVEGIPTLPDSVAVGWYGNGVFPLVFADVESHAVDVTESAHTLVQIVDEDGARAAIVEPKHASLIELSDEGDDDVVTDINEAGIVVGTRTVTVDEVTVDEGGFYTPAGGYVAFSEITSVEDQEAFGFEAPAALNDGAWVVGNHDGTSWLLRPPAEEEEPTTSSTVEPTSSTTEPEVTSTTEAPEVTSTTEATEVTVPTIPEVTVPTIPDVDPIVPNEG